MSHRLSRRDFLRSVGVASAGLALAACQQAPVTQPSDGQTTGTTPGMQMRVARVFDYDPTGTDAWVVADAEFETYFKEKYPDIELIREQAPWAGFTEKLLTSIAGGAKYDVIYGYWEWLPLFISNDVVSSLDPLIEADPELDASDFYDYAKETVDGQTYGLAWFISGWLHWFNRSVVQAAGATDLKELAEAGNWNYDTWYQFAKDFTGERDGVPVFGYEVSSTRSPTVYIMLAWAHGTELWNEDFTQSLVNSEANVELFNWLQQFYTEGLTPTPGMSTPDAPIGYTNERVIGTMAGQWYTRTIVQDGAPDKFDIGMTTFPKGPAGQYSVAALNSFYFGKTPEYPDAAWAWYKERSFSPEAARIYAPIGGGRFPSRKSIAPAKLYDWEDTDVYEAVRPMLRTYRVSPKESEWLSLWQVAWDEMALATRPVTQILDQLAQESTALVSG